MCPPRFQWRTNSRWSKFLMASLHVVSPLKECNSLGLMHYSIKLEAPYSSSMCALCLLHPKAFKTALLLGGDIEKYCDEDFHRVRRFEAISMKRKVYDSARTSQY